MPEAVFSTKMLEGVKAKAVGHRQLEDLRARGMHIAALRSCRPRCQRELRGKLPALENLKT